jgi:small subunit ribosomal protein S6
MRTYELIVIIRPTRVEEGKESFTKIMEKHAVQITSEDDWGSKRLAYEIDGCTEGFYLFKNVETTPESVEKITRDIRLDDVFLRSMFVVVEKKEQTA